MGQLIVETPVDVTINYLIADVGTAESLIEKLDAVALRLKSNPTENEISAIEPPRRNSLEKDLQAAFGIWRDNTESGEETAKRLREANRKIT